MPRLAARVLGALGCLFAAPASADSSDIDRAQYVRNQLIISGESLSGPAWAPLKSTLLHFGATQIRVDPRGQNALLDIPSSLSRHIDLDTLIRKLQLVLNAPALHALTSYPITVQKNFVYHGASSDANPLLVAQWGLLRIHGKEAWSRTTGTGVTVAVIDSGIAYQHRDLSENILKRSGSTYIDDHDPANPKVIDDSLGINFSCPLKVLPKNEVDVDSSGGAALEDKLCEVTGDANDDVGHGSHVAGIIGAIDNDLGVAGVSPDVRMLAIKALDRTNSTTSWALLLSIEYVAKLKPQIVNLSIDGDNYDPALLRCLTKLRDEADEVLVVAAGNANGHVDNDAYPTYPASYHLANMIVVESIDDKGALAPGSRFGRTTVDIAAPGHDIVSTSNCRSDYQVLRGTSQATAFVSGASALLRGLAPHWSAIDVRKYVLQTSNPSKALESYSVTGGVIDALAATSPPIVFLGSSEDMIAGNVASAGWKRVFQTDGCPELEFKFMALVSNQDVAPPPVSIGRANTDAESITFNVPSNSTALAQIRAYCADTGLYSDSGTFPISRIGPKGLVDQDARKVHQ